MHLAGIVSVSSNCADGIKAITRSCREKHGLSFPGSVQDILPYVNLELRHKPGDSSTDERALKDAECLGLCTGRSQHEDVPDILNWSALAYLSRP